MQPELRDLHSQSGTSYERTAQWLGVSVGHLWNCVNGLAHLTPEQDAALRSYYLLRIKKRLERLANSLGLVTSVL
jgi:hypothetical protein